MTFRTEIGDIHGSFKIGHDDRIVMLGSCFADNVGTRLERDGFNVVHNPLGPLFNPASIVNILSRGGRPYSAEDFVQHDGTWHCLDLSSRYRAGSPEILAEMVNADYLALWDAFERATVCIITFGTNKVYEYDGRVAGNCHKLPASMFTERFLSVDEIRRKWEWFTIDDGKSIFTLSPVKYPGDGLAQSCLSKSTLRVALDGICSEGGYDYFPSYEIVTEDLRDYRFYAADLKHPSDVAVDYIYDIFSKTYFTPETDATALRFRKEYLKSQHRPILDSKQ